MCVKHELKKLTAGF